MDESKKTKETKNGPNSAQKLLEEAIKKTSSPGKVDQLPLETTDQAGLSDEAKKTKGRASSNLQDSAAHGYDEVKFPRPANHVDGSGSSPSEDYQVPRASTNYEPVSPPLPQNEAAGNRVSSSYDVPAPSSSLVQPPSSGYMPLQPRPKTPENYMAKESCQKPSVPKSRSKDSLIALSRNTSRELVKTPSVSKGLDRVDENQKENHSSSSWSIWLSLAAIIIGIISLIFSVAALGVSSRTAGAETSGNLTAQLNNITSRLMGLSRDTNCSMSVPMFCPLEFTESTGKLACMTLHFEAGESFPSSIGCAVDISRSESTADQPDSFTASLFQDSDGLRCSCYHNNDTVVVDGKGIRCNMIAIHCL